MKKKYVIQQSGEITIEVERTFVVTVNDDVTAEQLEGMDFEDHDADNGMEWNDEDGEGYLGYMVENVRTSAEPEEDVQHNATATIDLTKKESKR